MNENGAAGNPETPVKRVIRVFGWPEACAIPARTPAALSKWDRPLSKGGGGGLVPARFQWKYLSEARAKGLPLSAEDLIAEPVQ